MNEQTRYVYLTTADINNFLDGKFNMENLNCLVVERNLRVLLTRYHMLEWLAVEEYTRQSRLMMINKYQDCFAVCGQFFDDILKSKRLSISNNAFINSASLMYDLDKSSLRDANFVLNENLILEKNILIAYSKGEFFARMARLNELSRLNGFDVKYLNKFHSLNRKHGIDLDVIWRRGEFLASVFERVSPFLKVFSNDDLRRRILKFHKVYKKKLNEMHEIAIARVYQSDVDDVMFQLYWRVINVLKDDPSEVGGLSELVDVRELMYLPISVVFSADKRMEPKIKKVLKDDSIFPSSWKNRIIRCGSESDIIHAITLIDLS